MAIKRIWHGWTTPENADVYWTAQAVLERWDLVAVHYEVLDERANPDLAGP